MFQFILINLVIKPIPVLILSIFSIRNLRYSCTYIYSCHIILYIVIFRKDSKLKIIFRQHVFMYYTLLKYKLYF